MEPEIIRYVLGALQNNTYLIYDPGTREAVIVDPTDGIKAVVHAARRLKLNLTQVWVTHAHFDHIAGLKELLPFEPEILPVGLHPADIPLWKAGAGARAFGMNFEPGCEPTILFFDQQILKVGNTKWHVIHTPGHTPGHVSFYNMEANVVLCGDVIFRESIGRTDLPGGDTTQLIASIENRLLNLPPHTRLFCGHGEVTTVGYEKRNNPFLDSIR